MRCLLAPSRGFAVRVGLIATAGLALPLAAQRVPSKPITEVRGERPRLTLTQVRRIGSEAGEHDAFGRIMSVALDSRGRVLVADDQNHRVAVFGADGRFAGYAGRKGEGPGELESPWRVVVDAQDSIFVWDSNNARVSVFAPDLRFRRSFTLPPQWLVTSMDFLPDGRLLIAAYGKGEPGGLHVVSRAGRRERTFGPRPPDVDLSGYEGSLLGGSADLAGATIAYSNKSPYEITFFDLSGRTRSRCTGSRRWTTAPTAVVRLSRNAAALEWNRFVHSSRIVGLGNGFFLNQVIDPVEDRTYFDLLTADCRLLRRVPFEDPLNIAAQAGSRLAAVQTLEYPEVVVYEVRITNPTTEPR
jgi:hypothetical protein